ncbi:hypothetical protein C1645_750474 [Glomus cerebriforme]|uniref:Uncharacterized protein n=1 Tax=Glomus cerebriforme TaxID=658196 RepID=A0A397TP46_9GLOM|nr:hypothetical protein C1645_750474 [Glomus cerebriforme]
MAFAMLFFISIVSTAPLDDISVINSLTKRNSCPTIFAFSDQWELAEDGQSPIGIVTFYQSASGRILIKYVFNSGVSQDHTNNSYYDLKVRECVPDPHTYKGPEFFITMKFPLTDNGSPVETSEDVPSEFSLKCGTEYDLTNNWCIDIYKNGHHHSTANLEIANI